MCKGQVAHCVDIMEQGVTEPSVRASAYVLHPLGARQPAHAATTLSLLGITKYINSLSVFIGINIIIKILSVF